MWHWPDSHFNVFQILNYKYKYLHQNRKAYIYISWTYNYWTTFMHHCIYIKLLSDNNLWTDYKSIDIVQLCHTTNYMYFIFYFLFSSLYSMSKRPPWIPAGSAPLSRGQMMVSLSKRKIEVKKKFLILICPVNSSGTYPPTVHPWIQAYPFPLLSSQSSATLAQAILLWLWFNIMFLGNSD